MPSNTNTMTTDRFRTIHCNMGNRDDVTIANLEISKLLNEGWMHGGTTYLAYPVLNITYVDRFVTLFR